MQITSQTADGRLVLVLVTSDRNPGDYYIFETVAKKADHLLRRAGPARVPDHPEGSERFRAALAPALAQALDWDLRPPTETEVDCTVAIAKDLKINLPAEALLFYGPCGTSSIGTCRCLKASAARSGGPELSPQPPIGFANARRCSRWEGVDHAVRHHEFVVVGK